MIVLLCSLFLADLVCAAEAFSNPLIFLHSLSSSRMTTKTVGKTPGAMNALRFRPKISDQVIIQRPRTEAFVSLRPMTIPARRRTGDSKDEIAVGIYRLTVGNGGLLLGCDKLINRAGRRYPSLRNAFAAPNPPRQDEERHSETDPSPQHAGPLESLLRAADRPLRQSSP